MQAQEILTERSRKLSDQELLEHLKKLLAQCGSLSGLIIDRALGRASASLYVNRFGSLSRAYQLVGFGNTQRLEFVELNRRLRTLHPEIIERTQKAIADLGGSVQRDPKTDLLTLNDELVISLVLARCQTLVDKQGQDQHRWHIRFDPARLNSDLTLAIRLDAANLGELDYYLLPRLDLPEAEIRVSNQNSANFECFRFDNLDFFYGMSQRQRVQRPS